MANANLATATIVRKCRHLPTQTQAAQDAKIGAIIDGAFGQLLAAMIVCDRAGHHATVQRLDRAMREVAKIRGIPFPGSEKDPAPAPKKKPRHLQVVRGESDDK